MLLALEFVAGTIATNTKQNRSNAKAIIGDAEKSPKHSQRLWPAMTNPEFMMAKTTKMRKVRVQIERVGCRRNVIPTTNSAATIGKKS
jgi:hypothetical protein